MVWPPHAGRTHNKTMQPGSSISQAASFSIRAGFIICREMNPSTLVETLQRISGEVRSACQIRGCWKWLATTEEPIE